MNQAQGVSQSMNFGSTSYNSLKTGDRFGRWVVQGDTIRKNEYGHKYILCRCECGNVKWSRIEYLLKGSSTGCKECFGTRVKVTLAKKERKLTYMDRVNLGDRFGEYTILKKLPAERKCVCRCSCGVVKKVEIYSLLKGQSTRCIDCYNKVRGTLPRKKKYKVEKVEVEKVEVEKVEVEKVENNAEVDVCGVSATENAIVIKYVVGEKEFSATGGNMIAANKMLKKQIMNEMNILKDKFDCLQVAYTNLR